MSDFVFSNSDSRCDNSKCKFIKNHSYPCSNNLPVEITRCSNFPCCRSNGHNNDCLFHIPDTKNEIQNYPSTMFNMQYQSLINDHKSYSNFNNNNDQRKFIINYTTINNHYYGGSQSSTIAPATPTHKLEDVMKDSRFMSEFSAPSNHLINYRR